MYASRLESLRILQLSRDDFTGVAVEHAEPGQPGKLPHQGGLRQPLLDERMPDLPLGQRRIGQHLP